MKHTKILAIMMVLAMCLSTMAALSISSSAVNVNLAEGKYVIAGNGHEPTGLTDGSTGGYFDLGWWSDTDGGEPYGLAGTCYVEIDLGENTEIGAIQVVNLVDSGRVYKWEAYATTDNTADIATWTKIGEKTNDDVSTAKGTTVTFEKMTARYVRVYGTYHNQNVGYHLAEVFVYDEYQEKELTWPDTMTISPAFVGGNGLENWRGTNVMIFAPSMYNEDLATVGAKITEGTYSVKFVIKDENTGDVYTISKYAFDHDDKTCYADANNKSVWSDFEIDPLNGIFRLVASDYQIPVTAGHTYSITGEITENGAVKYNIVTAEGKVFTALEENLGKADQAPAEGYEAPHEYDELNPVEPEEPIDPPTSGVIVPTGATCVGFPDWLCDHSGDGHGANCPLNVLDGDNSTCCGNAFRPDQEQSVTVELGKTYMVTSLKVSCKNEGPDNEGEWGYYRIFIIDGENEVEADVIPANPNGGDIQFPMGVKADAIKIMIGDWTGTQWAQVADVEIEGYEYVEPPVDPIDPPVAGDATAIIAVLAVVALFGAAVVTKKVFVK